MSEIDIIPVEPAELPASVNSEPLPRNLLETQEEMAALAGRFRAAREQIMLAFTYPGDWTRHGEGSAARACLGYAGAIRIGANFKINYSGVAWKKEEFSDNLGEGYRYIFTGYAELRGYTVYSEGIFSSRDRLLGWKGGEPRALEEIDECNVRRAAHHIFLGQCVKALLGLYPLPWTEFERIMGGGGRSAEGSAAAARGSGTQGGTTAEDSVRQKELAEICLAIANSGHTVDSPDGRQWNLRPLSDSDSRDSLEVAKNICEQLSAFVGRGGEIVPGCDSAKKLRGQRLNLTLAKARSLREAIPGGQS